MTTTPARRTRILKLQVVACLAGVLTFLQLSCNEALPPYHDPRDVFRAQIEGLYVLTINDNSMKVYLKLINKYDETFEAPVSIDGSIEIAWLRSSTVRKTFALTINNLITKGTYNQSKNILRVDPGDTLTFAVSWDFIDNSARDLRTSFEYYVDNECEQRCVANEEVFVLRGEAKVFEQIPAITVGPVQFSICHVKNWVNPQDCPPVLASIPCSTRPQPYAPPCPPEGN